MSQRNNRPTSGSSNKHLLEIYKEPEPDPNDDFLSESDVDDVSIQLKHSTLMQSTRKKNKHKNKKYTTPKSPNASARNWTLKLSKRRSDLSVSEFNQFEKRSLLGRGAYGEVHKVYHAPSGRTFAMKTVYFESQKEKMDDILREVLIMKNLNHKNIVTLYHYHLSSSRLDLIMEYCPGGSLRTLLKQKHRLPEIEVIQFTKQILNGLSYLHAHHIIHRDIKSANILLDENNIVKLADFGVSLNLKDNIHSSDMKEPYGSVYWMAPEVIKLRGASTASDVWSLGATVYELLTGDPPFGQYDPLPACHAIGTGEEIKYPDYISKDARDFMEKDCLVFNPQMRLTANELKGHRWLTQIHSNSSKLNSTSAKLAKYQETEEDYNDYEDEFDADVLDLKSVSKKEAMDRFRETDESFDKGFDFSSDDGNPKTDKVGTIRRELTVIRDIKQSNLEDLKTIHHLDNPIILNCLTSNNFILDLVYCLNSDRHRGYIFEMLRIANGLFKNRSASFDEFCYSGCIDIVLSYYNAAPEIVYQFLALFNKSQIGIQCLMSSGSYKHLVHMAKDAKSEAHCEVAVRIILQIFEDVKTRKDQLAVSLVSLKFPGTLIKKMSTGTHYNDEIIHCLSYIYEYCSEYYRSLFADTSFYNDLVQSINEISLDSTLRILRMIIKEPKRKGVIEGIETSSDIIKLLIESLLTHNTNDYHSYNLLARYSLEFFEILCSNSTAEKRFLGMDGLTVIKKLLHIPEQAESEQIALKDEAIRLFLAISKKASQKQQLQYGDQLFAIFWLIIDDRDWGQLALENIVNLSGYLGSGLLTKALDNSTNTNNLVTGLINTRHFDEYLTAVNNLILWELNTYKSSVIVKKLAGNNKVLNILMRNILASRGQTTIQMRVLYTLYRYDRPLSLELLNLYESLCDLEKTVNFVHFDKEASVILRKMIHLIQKEKH